MANMAGADLTARLAGPPPLPEEDTEEVGRQPVSLATCASVLRFVALCSLAARRLSGD